MKPANRCEEAITLHTGIVGTKTTGLTNAAMWPGKRSNDENERNNDLGPAL